MKSMVPTEFRLSRNYPNPFTGTTTIKFCLPCRTRARIDILMTEGVVLKTLLDEEREAGTFEIELDGGTLPEGSYVCRLRAGEFVDSKMMLVQGR